MNKEIELVNAIIKEAVKHGGDSGGAYFCNDKKLRQAINNWLDFKNFNKNYDIVQPPIGFDWEWEDIEEYYNLVRQADFCQIMEKE